MNSVRPLAGGRLAPRPDRFPRRPVGLGIGLVLVVTALAAFSPSVSGSAAVLRESYAPATWDTSFANVFANQKDAQSFTARTSFLVTHVELYVFDQPNPTADLLQVFIASDGGNRPGAVLGGTAQQGKNSWTWVAFSFYPWIPLTSGGKYWIVAENSQPRPKGYEWAMNSPGDYVAGEAQWWDSSQSRWIGNTGADLFFKVYGISGPFIGLELSPTLLPIDPGSLVPVDVYFNNSGNQEAQTARIEMRLDPGLVYAGDDASMEGGVQISPLVWTFNSVGVGAHRMTVWVVVEPNPAYYDGQSLTARAYLNYTDASGAWQATSSDLASVTVLVPVIRVQLDPEPDQVDPGQVFSLTTSFFNVGSGRAKHVWLNALAGSRLTVLGDDAATAGGTSLGPLSWRFDDVAGETYVFNVTVRADPGALPGDRLPFRVNASYTDGLGHPFGRASMSASPTIHGPSLVVEAITDNPWPRPGDTLHVILYLNNTGDASASRIWLNNSLPSWALFQGSTPVSGQRTGDIVLYAFEDVPVGPFAIRQTFEVVGIAPPDAALRSSATLDVLDGDGRALRPSATTVVSTVVTPRFNLVLGSTASAARPGEELEIVLGWNNTGNEAAPIVWVNFTLPEKTLLVNASLPWLATSGRTFGWVFTDVGPGERTIRVRLEVSARVTGGEDLLGRLELRYLRADGALSGIHQATLGFEGSVLPAVQGLEILLFWIAILIALFLLFLLLSYLDLLPHRRPTIDDVFLLHNSGILICHYSTTLRPDVDSDIASGMLMAVRNFVADALRSKNGSLQELKYGDYRIQMAHGRYSVLVVFTRGGAPKNLQSRMAEALRNIETAYERILESWSGRTEDFRGVEEHLLRLVEA